MENRSQNNRRIVLLFSISMIAGLFLSLSRCAYADESQSLKPWQTAYLQILQEERVNRDRLENNDEKIAAYLLNDVDKDGIPELFLRFGTSTAGMECAMYTVRNNTAVLIDRFAYGGDDLYSCPDKNGILRVHARMYHCRAELMTFDEDKLSSETIFEEFLEGGAWYTPVHEYYPGAVPLTEFIYYSDYPLLTYDIWSKSAVPLSAGNYPNNDEKFFDQVTKTNTPVLSVPIITSGWVINDTIEEIGLHDLIASLIRTTTPESEEQDSDKFRAFLVDLNHDGKLEYLLSYHNKINPYDYNDFILIFN